MKLKQIAAAIAAFAALTTGGFFMYQRYKPESPQTTRKMAVKCIEVRERLERLYETRMYYQRIRREENPYSDFPSLKEIQARKLENDLSAFIDEWQCSKRGY